MFRDDRPHLCNECFARGIQCIDQEAAGDAQPLESRQSLRERVAQLENVVKNILQRVEPDDGASSSSEKSTSAVTKAFAHADLATAEAVLENAPIMSLFNNSILDSHAEIETPGCQSHTDGKMSVAEDKIRQKLLVYLPSSSDLDIMFEEGSAWWGVWQHVSNIPVFRSLYSNHHMSDVPGDDRSS